MSDAHSLAGRATRGWPVYDLKAEEIAFLKDRWRSLFPHLDKEESLLKQLTDTRVRNLPKYICGDDMGIGQITAQPQKFIGKVWKAGPKSELALIMRSHRRLLAELVGHCILKFESSHQLMQAICDAYLGMFCFILWCHVVVDHWYSS